MDDLARTLADQRAYYAARAAEYDEWLHRQGRYDLGPELNAQWRAEVETVQAALEAARLTGEVLEPACGTGIWTERLARTATRITALDASSEMIAINRHRLAAAGLAERVTYRQADLFAWEPDRAYDAVFIGFFLSHVPTALLDPFLATVAAALRPGGTLFVVDTRRRPTTSSAEPPLADDEVITRRLNDGREFRVIKVFYEPAALTVRMAAAGLEMEITETPTHFLYGVGTAGRPPRPPNPGGRREGGVHPPGLGGWGGRPATASNSSTS